jgi:hypothetical protein
MKKISIILATIIFLGGCIATKNRYIFGNYKSSCYNLGFPELEAVFNIDSTFQYRYAHDTDFIFGRWKISNDTLFLHSEMFEKEIISLDSFVNLIVDNPESEDLPEVFNGKFTEIKNMDAYLIRGKRLYRLTKNGYTKDCHLIKTIQH